MHFGPLAGTRLTNLLRNARRLNVIGTLSDNVSLCNINEVINNINSRYTNPFIVAIDAALSTPDRVGQILVTDGPLQLGSSLNRTGVQVGDIAVRGVVGRNTGNINQNLNILRNVPLARVVNLSDIVSSGIYNCINYECNE